MRVDCNNCDNYPMTKTMLAETGGMGVYWRCQLCNCTVRIPGVKA